MAYIEKLTPITTSLPYRSSEIVPPLVAQRERGEKKRPAIAVDSVICDHPTSVKPEKRCPSMKP